MIYLLKLTPKAIKEIGHEYDCNLKLVVRARDEASARELAFRLATKGSESKKHGYELWNNRELSTCERVLTTGLAEIICEDFFEA